MSSPRLQPVRGTHDILPDEFEKFHAVVNRARDLATLYGFREMATPIFEPTEVFARSMGETSDVVSKEMFSFDTKGGESVALRPEFTAGIVRAFISNGMQQHLPLKLFSTGPLFRYERPQKGRQRQFHQVNFEWLGDGSAEADVEIIMLAGQLLYYLSGRKGCKLLINTLGDVEGRANYREKLVSYLAPYAKELSEDSQRRLVANPLRILDSKDPRDQAITQSAPKITDCLNDDSRRRFERICSALSDQATPLFQTIEVSPSLVRGLDYYTDTVFEFVAETGELGAQNTVLAGGRYDGLVEMMGGKPTPAIGFAAGVERLLLLTAKSLWLQTDDIKIFILPFEAVIPEIVLNIATGLRVGIAEELEQSRIKQKASVEILWQGKLSKRLERASARGASHTIIIGEDEAQREACKLKDMRAHTESEVPLDDLVRGKDLALLFGIKG